MTAVPIVLARRRCALCREPGHKAPTCPTRRTAVLAVVPDLSAESQPDDKLKMIADLRAQFDAIAVETAEYERVRTELDIRISENNRKRAAIAVEIKQLRGHP